MSDATLKKIDGACLCGQVRYEAMINPARVAICHCTDCQVNSATAFRFGVLVRAENFRLLAGELKTYVKTAQSGNPRRLSFCPDCGTSIHGSDLENTRYYSLRLGTARQRAELRPLQQMWCRSALPWLDSVADMPRYAEGGKDSLMPPLRPEAPAAP